MWAEVSDQVVIGAIPVAVRAGLFFALLPIPVSGRLPLPVAAGISVVFSVFLVSCGVLPDLPAYTFSYVLLTLPIEAAIGAFLGICVRAVFAVYEVIAGLAGLSIGYGDIGPMRTLFMMIGLCVFVLMRGHHLLFRILMASFEAFPVATVSNTDNFRAILTAVTILIRQSLLWGVLLALPLIAAGCVAEFVSQKLNGISGSIEGIASPDVLRPLAVILTLAFTLAGLITFSADGVFQQVSGILNQLLPTPP